MNKLQLAISTMTQGIDCICPRCGSIGRFERKENVKSLYPNYIRFNLEMNRIDCYNCEDIE